MKLEIDATEIFAATGGRPFDAGKPAVIFLHGAGMDHTAWAMQARWFAWHGFSALAVDLPGHGKSAGKPLTSVAEMADWVLRLLDSAGLKQAALVGHSMGAAVALEVAARDAASSAPGRITGLALLGISAAMPVNPALIAAAKDDPAEAYDMMTSWSLASGAKIGGNRVPGLWMTGATRALLLRNRPGVLRAGLQACADWTTGPESARSIVCPTTILAGEQDMMTPARAARALAAEIPGARLVTIPNSGHMMMSEQPDATLDALIAALAGEAVG